MWKLLFLVSISIVFTSCRTVCKNSIYTWEYPTGNVVDSRDLEDNSSLISSIQPQDTLPKDTVSDPDNITTLSLYHDTLFLRREVERSEEWTDYNYVFIDTNPDSKYYSWLTSFEFDEYDSMSMEAHGMNPVPGADVLLANEKSGLPKTWIPLYALNDQYYIYKPSDFGFAGRRILTDSQFIKWYMDGPMPFKILLHTTSEIEWHSFELEVHDGVKETLNIHLLDEARQIYVFENPDESDRYRYRLYIPTDRARDYDIIVNTGNQKAREYDFDEIDFEKLLGTSKQ